MKLTQQFSLTPSCRPLLKWPGGKRSELPFISPFIPSHVRYFEPFFGGGSVFFDAITVRSYANDLHPDLMVFYACVRARETCFFDLLLKRVEEWETGTLEDRGFMYYECRTRYNAGQQTTAERAVDFFLLRELAYGGMFRVNRSGHFNVPFGRAYGKNKNLREKVEHLMAPAVQAKMDLLDMSMLDFEEFLNRFKFNQNDFMFVDPPYDTRFSKYDQTVFDESDQRRLAECLENFEGKFMLICKLTPLVEHLYCRNGFRICQYESNYKFNIKGRFSRSSTHVRITNYDNNQRS